MKHIFTTFLLSIISIGFAQIETKWDWAINSNSQSNYHNSFTDDEGNTYLLGEMEGTTHSMGDLSIPHENYKLVLPGMDQICIGNCPITFKTDIYITKINKTGEVLWIQSIEGTENETGLAITANDNGEVWILAKTTSDSIYIDQYLKKITPNSSQTNESMFLAKLSKEGEPEFIKDIEGDDALLSSAWLFTDNNVVTIFGNFSPGSDNTVELLNQSIPSNYAYTTTLQVDLNTNDGTLVEYKKIGKTINSSFNNTFSSILKHNGNIFIYGNTTAPSIEIDNQKTTFQGTEFIHNYLIQLNENKIASSTFEVPSSTGSKVAVNDNLIVFAMNNPQVLSTNLVTVSYFDYSGVKIKEHFIESSSSNEFSPSIKPSTIVINEANDVTMSTLISDTTIINNTTYIIPPSITEASPGETVINTHNDILLLHLNYNTGLIYNTHLKGDYLNDDILSMETVNDNIRLIGYFESFNLLFNQLELNNTNDLYHYSWHAGEPSIALRQKSIFVADFIIKDPIVSLQDVALNNDLLIYPNPSSGKVTLDNIQPTDKVGFYSMNGDLLFSETGKSQFNNLKPGGYLVKVINENSTFIEKLIVH